MWYCIVLGVVWVLVFLYYGCCFYFVYCVVILSNILLDLIYEFYLVDFGFGIFIVIGGFDLEVLVYCGFLGYSFFEYG